MERGYKLDTATSSRGGWLSRGEVSFQTSQAAASLQPPESDAATALPGQVGSLQNGEEMAFPSQLNGADLSREKQGATNEPKAPAETAQLDMEFMQALRSAGSATQLRKSGEYLLEKVRDLKKKHKYALSEKIQMLEQERRRAQSEAEAQRLKVLQLRRQLEHTKTEYKLVDSVRVKTLQAQLSAAIKERETWKERADKFEDTIDTLKIVSSLQRSLQNSKEDSEQQQYKAQLDQCMAENNELKTAIERIVHEKELAAEQQKYEVHELKASLEQALMERDQVKRERNNLVVKFQQERERSEKLQHLIKKLKREVEMASAQDIYDI